MIVAATGDRKVTMSRPLTQVLAFLAIAFVVLVIWNFSQRVTLTLSQQQAEQSLDQQIAQAQATRDALENVKKNVQTDTFVEEQARGQHYVRDGENVVIPQKTPAAPAPASPPPAPPPAPERTWWEILIQFLFGP